MSDPTGAHPGASGELPHWWANVPKPLQHGTGEYQPPGYPTTTAFGVPTRFVPGPLNSGRLNQALDELQGQFSVLGLNISAGDTAPANPPANALWFDSAGCQLYVYYDDGTSRQWVPASSLVHAGPLRLWGKSSALNDYDAQIGATGGATVPGNPGHGELNYRAGRHIFQGYDGTTNFRVSNTPQAQEWWEAIGSGSGVGATLRTGTTIRSDCDGVIVAQGSGKLTFGNGEGAFLTMPAINKQIVNSIQLDVGGWTESVGLRAAGGDGLPCTFNISGSFGGGVALGNSNGPIAQFKDPANAPNVSRNAYFVVSAGNASSTPEIAVSTAGVTTPPASAPFSLTTVGSGAFVFGNGAGTPTIKPATGNLFLGQSGGLATTATAGYIQIPTTTGPPTGVPSNASAGATMVVDATNHNLWVYVSGTWRSATLT